MELNKPKKAISLIELLIALSMTAVLMLMLFGIVSKKTRDGIVHLDGVFYCWKDWEGKLYQKTSTESIQSVSSCKIKIPKDAKNVQVFIIGGGAGGYQFDKTSIGNIINNNHYETTNDENLDCLKSYENVDSGNKCLNSNLNNGLYTRMHTSRKNYAIITECDEQNVPGLCNIDVQITGKPLSAIRGTVSNTSPFNNSFIDDLISKEHCYIPVYYNGVKNFVKSKSSMKDGELCYYMGSAKTGKCFGTDKNNRDEDSNKLLADGINAVCYQDGILLSKNTGYTISTDITDSEDINKLSYKSIKSSMNLGVFRESLPGDIKRGYAEPGKEYTISADKIGDGGAPGSSGKATQFGNLKANGGGYKTGVNINITTPTGTINSINALNEVKNFTLCQQGGLNCKGTISEQLMDLASGGRIKVSDNAEITPAIYNKDKWQESSNPQKSTDSITKTGFAYFGASGPAVDCNVQYYPVKSIKFNDFIIEEKSRNAKINTCATLGHGMGGAIIIKWD